MVLFVNVATFLMTLLLCKFPSNVIIEVWVKIHLVSDNLCNIVNL